MVTANEQFRLSVCLSATLRYFVSKQLHKTPTKSPITGTIKFSTGNTGRFEDELSEGPLNTTA